MSRAEQTLKWYLRLVAFGLLLALGAVFLPFHWMAAINDRLGLSPLDDTPLLNYLTRSLSALYAFHGGLIFFISSDVRRYASLIRFTAYCTLVLGGFLWVLDLLIGMPAAWVIGEGPVVIVLGVVPLVLLSKCETSAPP